MTTSNSDNRKLLSALCHGSSLFSWAVASIGIPIAVMLLTEDTVVKDNAKEALNFQINMIIYWVICFVLMFVLIGFPLMFVLGVITLIMPIIAMIQVASEPDRPYRYPFVIHFL
ncbi:MAG: DUF4870 domain-containing protein [Elainella sp. Prado103]|jgi:hypothetical protein|nr:DUF4870 domain-containing protein [Elainella sp. Prado103]